LAACGELGQNDMADKVVSTIFLTFCRWFAALTFIKWDWLQSVMDGIPLQFFNIFYAYKMCFYFIKNKLLAFFVFIRLLCIVYSHYRDFF